MAKYLRSWRRHWQLNRSIDAFPNRIKYFDGLIESTLAVDVSECMQFDSLHNRLRPRGM
jgi:hypothetical protein